MHMFRQGCHHQAPSTTLGRRLRLHGATGWSPLLLDPVSPAGRKKRKIRWKSRPVALPPSPILSQPSCRRVRWSTHVPSMPRIVVCRLPPQQNDRFQTFFPRLTMTVEEKKMETMHRLEIHTDSLYFLPWLSIRWQILHAFITAATAGHLPYRS